MLCKVRFSPALTGRAVVCICVCSNKPSELKGVCQWHSRKTAVAIVVLKRPK
ncbi:hypothetical protein BY458DRAFT_499167 [Sporodiniella umbellata]|nr:hypothetical protein BY458DRAFT_499167 [Sporodiniella umbellata]